MINADKVFKSNTEILKIFKGINLEWEKAIPIPSADAYVQDGLVFQLDGIDKGNVEGAWVDRKAGSQFTLNNCIVNSNNIEFNGTDSSAVYNQLLDFGTKTTVEVVFIKETNTGTIISSGDKVQLMAVVNTSGYKYSYFSGNYITGQTFPDPTAIHTLSIPTRGRRPILDQIAQPKTYKSFYSVSDTTNTYVGGGPSYLKGKIYSIRIYNRNITEAEMIKNQMIDIERFNIPGYETVNLTIEGNDGTPMTGARFAFLGNQYVYDGNPVTLKVPKGTYYQIDFSCVPDYAACEFLGTYVAEENNVRNLKAIYTYDGWGDYFVSNINLSGSTAEVRDGVTYYKVANLANFASTKSNIKIYHYPNNENFYTQFGNKYNAVSSVETVPHIYTGSTNSGIWNSGAGANSQTFYNIVHLNSRFYLNGVKYTGTARRFGSLNSNGVTKLENNMSYENYISPIEVAAGRHDLNFSNAYYSQISNIDTLIIGPSDGTSVSSIFSISVVNKFNVNRIPNLLQIYPFMYFDLSKVTFKSKEGLIETLITNSLDRSAFDPVSITLSSPTKALLTSDEIAQITSKGYTIA